MKINRWLSRHFCWSTPVRIKEQQKSINASKHSNLVLVLHRKALFFQLLAEKKDRWNVSAHIGIKCPICWKQELSENPALDYFINQTRSPNLVFSLSFVSYVAQTAHIIRWYSLWDRKWTHAELSIQSQHSVSMVGIFCLCLLLCFFFHPWAVDQFPGLCCNSAGIKI